MAESDRIESPFKSEEEANKLVGEIYDVLFRQGKPVELRPPRHDDVAGRIIDRLDESWRVAEIDMGAIMEQGIEQHGDLVRSAILESFKGIAEESGICLGDYQSPVFFLELKKVYERLKDSGLNILLVVGNIEGCPDELKLGMDGAGFLRGFSDSVPLLISGSLSIHEEMTARHSPLLNKTAKFNTDI